LAQLLIQIVLIACCSHPWQGDAFGTRMLCESAPLVALGLTALYRPRPRETAILALFTAACVLWTVALMVFYVRGGLSADPGYADVIRGVLRLAVPGRFLN
jgi:hypothetical protein